MKVEILDDGITAKDENGKVYKVKGINLRKDNNNGTTFYANDTKFFKTCCPSKTTHEAEVVNSTTVSLL